MADNAAELDHLVIGPGKFGLGFAGDLAHRAGWRTAVVFREGCSPNSTDHFKSITHHRQYDIRYFGHTEAHSIDVDAISTSYSSLGAVARDAFTSPQLKLISVTVPHDAVKDVGALLAEGLLARSQALGPDSSVAILACINHKKGSEALHWAVEQRCKEHRDSALKHLIARRHFPDCIVDRVCSGIRVSDQGRVEVSVERFGKLIVEGELAQPLQFLLERNPTVVSNVIGKAELEAWQDAKYWGINGLHIFLAAAVRQRRRAKDVESDLLADHLRAEPYLEMMAKFYLQEVIAAVAFSAPGQKSAIKAYLYETIARFKEGTDTATRMLRELRVSEGDREWRTRVKTLDAKLASLYTSPEIDPVVRQEAISNELSEFMRFALGAFLGKVKDRVLAPGNVVRNKIELVPIGLNLAAGLVMETIVEEFK